jgi:hypothetical protein
MTNSLQVLDDQRRGLRINFHWHRDRFSHSIGFVDKERFIPLLASHEGTESDPWPLSPPLQDLSVAEIETDQRSILLVGRAGKSHWSASVETSLSPLAIQLDVACRVYEIPQILCSSYRSMTIPAISSPSQVAVEVGGHTAWLQAEAVPDAESYWELTAEGCALRTIPIHSDAPQTVRWKYRITVANPP